MKRTDILKPLELRSGAGGSFENGLCVMEVVAWLGGENATDTPECACPILGSFAIKLNDSLSDTNRQQLKPLASQLQVSAPAQENMKNSGQNIFCFVSGQKLFRLLSMQSG